ncbi:MAG: hypothetical protein CM1200mP25_0100 [Acidobacteriota bacterium]|nr:MAG: hypothetical protein CM1200mP25_0100 [Acidobacteriota bacterium]
MYLGAERSEPTVADAARNADWVSVQVSLDGGVDVTISQGDGSTALHWAVHWEQVDIAARLIAAGADVNPATDLGVTPLWRRLRTVVGNSAPMLARVPTRMRLFCQARRC